MKLLQYYRSTRKTYKLTDKSLYHFKKLFEM